MIKFVLAFLLLGCVKYQTFESLVYEPKQSSFSVNSFVSSRPNDPVILKAPFAFLPNELVAFRYDNGWHQIRVQVDEMDSIDIAKPYNGYLPLTGYKTLLYTDTATWTGSDSNPLIDNNDEIVFMSKDAGSIGDASYPDGTVAGTKRQVTINDPLAGTSYIYLFKSESITQDQGSYVTYTFSPNYKTNFNVSNGAINPENSVVVTPKYSIRFTSEWMMPEIVVGGFDILDANKSFFANGDCRRTEQTFSNGENAFIVNKSGAVRAIRMILGSNSGPHTACVYLFYEGKVDIVNDLRVHSVESIYNAFDYNDNAIGMKYSNNIDLRQSTIDGVPDTRTVAGTLLWENISGSFGSLIMLHRRAHSFSTKEIKFTGYYDDNAVNPASNCTGDGKAIGTSGFGVTFPNANLFTEVNRNGLLWTSRNFRTYRHLRAMYFETPNATNSLAQNYNTQYANPLTVSIQ